MVPPCGYEWAEFYQIYQKDESVEEIGIVVIVILWLCLLPYVM